MKMMNDLGLRITCKDGSAPAIPPSISHATSLALSSGALEGSASADSLHRPASAFTISSTTMKASSPMNPESSSSPNKSEFNAPLRPNTAFSDQGQVNHVPYSTPYVLNPYSSTLVSKNVQSSPRSRIESFNLLPSHQSGSVYISQLEREVSG